MSPAQKSKAITPDVILADVYSPDEGALSAVRSHKCATKPVTVELFVVLFADDLAPVVLVRQCVDEPRFQMNIACTMLMRIVSYAGTIPLSLKSWHSQLFLMWGIVSGGVEKLSFVSGTFVRSFSTAAESSRLIFRSNSQSVDSRFREMSTFTVSSTGRPASRVLEKCEDSILGFGRNDACRICRGVIDFL
jgi:hypothetical protein